MRTEMAKIVIPDGKEINKPFPNDKEGFSVYAKNQSGDIVLVRFSGNPSPIHSEDPSTPAYWNEKTAGVKTKFKHKAFFDTATRRIRSVRDGIQEYSGFELGIEPFDKTFTVYRSPSTISAITGQLSGLPITNDHVSADQVSDVKKEDVIGALTETEVIELLDESTNSSLCLENGSSFSDAGVNLIKNGKKEFSLGYTGKLKEHDVYDFEQYEINSTHLALVDSARGGSVLTFADKEGKKMTDKAKKLNKVFLDAEGNANLQQIVEMAGDVTEALKTIPQEELSKVVPMLKEIIALGKGGDSAEETTMSDEDKEAMKDEAKQEMLDADIDEMDEDERTKFGDSKLFKSIVASQSKSFEDSDVFKTAVDGKIKAHASVIEKASDFVADGYTFADKSTTQIMKDALAVEHGDAKFEDSELTVAFKLLKRSSSDLTNFADGSEGKSNLEKRIESSLED